MNSARAAAIACFHPSGSLPSLRRSNSVRTSAGAFATRPAQAVRASRPLAPIARHSLSKFSGMTNGGESHPRIFRAPAISSSPGACAMRLLRAGLGREAEPDDRLARNHRRLVRHRARGRNRLPDRIRIVPVDLLHMPARSPEPLHLIVGKPKGSWPRRWKSSYCPRTQ